MIKVQRVLTKDFYPTMVEWWKGNDFQVVNPSMLPEFTFVSYNAKGVPTYSMCFYNTDSNLAWIGWQLKNPTVDKEDKIGNLKCLFQHVEQYAKTLGYHILFTTSNTKPVENIMQGLGYGIGDINVKHYLKQL